MKTNVAAAAATLAIAAALRLADTTTIPAVAAEGSDGGQRIEGGTITYVHQQEPPCLWGGWVQQAYLSRQVFDDLVSYDDGRIRPWLATDWSKSQDRKTITFHLRKDVTFTDGTKFDADAVVANLEGTARP